MSETRPDESAIGGLRGSTVFGWLSPDHLGSEPALELQVAGGGSFTVSVRVTSHEGRLEFEADIPELLRDGQIRLIDLRIMGEDAPLSGGPLIFDGGLFDAPVHGSIGPEASVEAEGQVQFDGESRVTGWAWMPGAPDATVIVELWSDTQLIASVAADQPGAGPDGEGRHGFSFDVAQYLRGGPHSLEICVEGSRGALPGGRLTVGALAKDGALPTDDYLADSASSRLFASLPLEQFAYASTRMAPGRLVPRLVNRLKRERAALAAARGMAALVLLGDQDTNSRTSQLWRRQSYRRIMLSPTPSSPAELREIAAKATHVFFAKPGDLLHPSAVATVLSDGQADAFIWNRFCGRNAEAGASGKLWRRPRFDPATWRHGSVTDTTIAVKGQILADCPDEVAAALIAGRFHPLFFWLAAKDLEWRTIPEALTVQVGEFHLPDREEILEDWPIYEDLLLTEGEVFRLEPTPPEHPFPFVLVPSRRAAKTSVLICYRDRPEITLRAIQSLSRQHLTGELEVVLVDNQSSTAAAHLVVEGAVMMLGPERVVALSYDAPFNHSAQNNLAASAATGEVVVICNNDVTLDDPLCIEQLSAWALQPGVGAVGCRLEDPDRSRASLGHAFRPFADDPFLPPLQESVDPVFALHVHACPGVTLALGAMSRERFLDLGGLDEVNFPIGHNDTELMLRCAEHGLTHLYLGHVKAIHARGSSRTGDDEDRHTLSLNQRFGGVLARRFVQLGQETIEGRSTKAAAATSRLSPPTSPSPEVATSDRRDRQELELQTVLDAHRQQESERLREVQSGAGDAAILDGAPGSRDAA